MASPTYEQTHHLKLMRDILCSNSQAKELAECLWRFFDFRLCIVLNEDRQRPNSFHITGLELEPFKIGFRISLGVNKRQEVGLIHELLHAKLIMMGYPMISLSECEAKKFQTG